MYIHERADWPHFRFDEGALMRRLAPLRLRQGRLLGRLEALGFEQHEQALLGTLTEDSVRSSEIEGEFLDPDQVRSSIARRLGITVAGLVPAERRVEGMVEMMLDATRNYAAPLTAERLFAWHAALFADGRGGRMLRGAYRDGSAGAMQVVSGPIGRETVHFEAPAASRVEAEMALFLEFCAGGSLADPVLEAGVAHLWFLTIHPFDDGNGRIARAISDRILARSEGTSQRAYSLSGQICAERRDYYRELEAAQKGDLDISRWLEYFLGVLERAFDRAEGALSAVLARARFWERHAAVALNDRQKKVLARLLEGFEGKLTSSKWARLVKCSQDTALRDIDDLVRKGILEKDPQGGRSTSYSLLAG